MFRNLIIKGLRFKNLLKISVELGIVNLDSDFNGSSVKDQKISGNWQG